MQTKPKIIAISGAMGSGKSTMASELVTALHATEIAFADPLKKAAAILFGVDVSTFHTQEGKAAMSPKWGLTHRDMLQKFGTEAIRGTFGGDFWVLRAKLAIEAAGAAGSKYVVLSDCRFEDEAAWVRATGGIIIHVIRPNNPFTTTGGEEHASEKGYPDKYKTVRVINSKGLTHYLAKIKVIADSIKREVLV